MIQYMIMLNNPNNEEIVATIIQPILEGDVITDEVVRENLARVPLLSQIGETEIHDELVKNLLEDDTYRKHMITETGS